MGRASVSAGGRWKVGLRPHDESEKKSTISWMPLSTPTGHRAPRKSVGGNAKTILNPSVRKITDLR